MDHSNCLRSMPVVLSVMVMVLTLPAWGSIDLSKAVILPQPNEGIVGQAARMLRDELNERSGVLLPIADSAAAGQVAIAIGTASTADGGLAPDDPEGYGIVISGSTISLIGRDPRGAMFAAGRLIRLVDCKDGAITLDLRSPISTAPDVPYRAHQLGYRNTANTYDAWTMEMYEQYIRDLIVFGCNGIELITTLDPEAKDGPVMTESMRARNVKLSALFGSYGLDVWLWSPVMADGEEDVTTPEGAAVALEKRRTMFAQYPVIDHVFIPGGDDGDTPAEHLIPFMEKLAPVLHESHPDAKLWVSNQTFTLEENHYFFNYLETEKPDWLAGVVYGPWTKMSWEEMRERTPEQYPLRRYPDINHTVRCQYPVRDWDPVFANTVGREPMMPLPKAHKHIYLRYRDITNGFGTYSDGIHDDLNKVIWSAYGWDPDTDLDELLVEYGKVWWNDDLAEDVAKGLFLFEENWVGPILENTTIPKTLELWESIAKRTSNFDMNWRAQMYLFRARFDAYVQEKAKAEAQFQQDAHAALATARQAGVEQAIADARQALAKADKPIAPELRQGIEELGPVLLKSIGYQLSVKEPYFARNPERGAMLDWLDQPVNDRPWLEQRFDDILSMEYQAAQLEAIDEILHWTDPGPGGFYDNLGAVGQYEHVVYQKTWEQDPYGCHSPRAEFPLYKADPATVAEQSAAIEEANAAFKEEDGARPQARQELRMSWQSQIGTHYGTPLKMRYEGLDPEATYRLKVTYAGRYQPTMSLTLNDTFSIHGPVKQPDP
ncbi:MAG: hypothetical protein KJ060_11935, partial [Candidatus Hydrogenedentes bacterium]|nr:hypothetical protein [Candidatus Hydrogenedentota bacterium]